jgi:hypothetical protein
MIFPRKDYKEDLYEKFLFFIYLANFVITPQL